MIYREHRLTKAVREYDPDLSVIRGQDGKLYLHKDCVRLDRYDFNGQSLCVSRVEKLMICALTDNWLATGNPVDWGVQPLLDKIRSMDAFRDDRFVYEALDSHEKHKEQKARDFSNKNQAFLRYEAAPIFKKAFADYRTAGMDERDHMYKIERNNKWVS